MATRDLSFYRSYIAEEIRAEGQAQAGAESILVVLGARGLAIPDHVRGRVTSCTHLDTLTRWHRRAVTAPTAEDIFTDLTDLTTE
ncbi:hypothetical protein [Streptomyces poonensis]|uniref:Uncharacterized protein n=1 Tax=Streptomyces poonensis TaxID=68255 RepID=A0A918PJL8_9ACTN|nr:hypothetical protein [Streptomyces poonensis]GGZ12729.1 hypothetical protein GCM10010365_35520 [Streptomyces poonensis]GLJ91993.1 hypothetical protein GCM10017589_46010 [Streptomyces poonensis]